MAGPGKMQISGEVRFPNIVKASSGADLRITVVGNAKDVGSVRVRFTYSLYRTPSAQLRPGHAAIVIKEYPAKLNKGEKESIITVHVPFRRKGERGGSFIILYTQGGETEETDPVSFPVFTVD